MSVSLCAFRLELGGDSIVPKDLTYLGTCFYLAISIVFCYYYIFNHQPLSFWQWKVVQKKSQKRGCLKQKPGKEKELVRAEVKENCKQLKWKLMRMTTQRSDPG